MGRTESGPHPGPLPMLGEGEAFDGLRSRIAGLHRADTYRGSGTTTGDAGTVSAFCEAGLDDI